MPKRPVAKQVVLPDFLYAVNNDNDKRFINKALVKLLEGSYGGDFEKLPPTNLYSMRLEGKGRILLVKLAIGGIPTLALVECLLEHEYEQSTCLAYRRRELNNHIKKCAAGEVYVLDEAGLDLKKRDGGEANPPGPLHQLVEYGARYIEASDAQSIALLEHEDNRKVVLYGEAGSGKTLVLMHHLATLAGVLATDEASTRRIWVIVPHAPLQQHLEQEWHSQSTYHEIKMLGGENPVHIVTPDIFYRRLDGIADTVKSKDYHDFLEWLPPDDLDALRSLCGRLHPMQVYQELCVLNGLIVLKGTVDEAKKLYCTPELNQAFLETKDKPKTVDALVSLLQRYQVHLTTSNGFNPFMYQPQNKLPEHDYVFEDEAQNLPPGLLNLPHVFIAMNDSQSIGFKRRVNELLLAYLNKGSIIYTELPGTHRCPKQPIKLAARVDAFVAHHINPKRKHAHTSSPLRAANYEEGLVCFMDGTSAEDLVLLKQIVQEPDTAVVYLTTAAEEEFNQLGIKPLCSFTQDNPILGLEFKRVLVVSPFDSSLTRIYKSGISARDELGANEIAEYERYLNTVKGAMTRSTDTLVVVQAKTHDTASLLDFFKEDVVCSSLGAVDMNDAERAELLYEQACRLYREGQTKMALGIIKHLKRSPEVFLQELNPEAHLCTSLDAPPASKDATAPLVATVPTKEDSNDTQALVDALPPVEPVAVTALASTTPLSEKLHDYVEQLVTQATEANLRKLLLHKRAAFMLFHHKMDNGLCLFANLFLAKGVSPFLVILDTDTAERQALESAISTIPKDDIS